MSGPLWDELPSSWLTGQVKNVATVTLGKMLQPSARKGDMKRVYMRAANVQPDGVLELEDNKEMWFSQRETSDLTILRGDVVVVEGGQGGFGRAAFVDQDLEGWGFQNSINRLRPRTGHDGRYLAYYLIALRAAGFVRPYCNVVSMPHLTAEKLAAIQLPVPPARTQRAIADYLDRETAQIDTLISEQQRLIGLLRERKVATVEAAFAGGSEDRIPLKLLAAIQTGVTLSGEGDPEDGEWPYLRVANVQVGHVDTETIKTVRVSAEKAAQSTLQTGDVLMTEGGDLDKLGRGALWDGAIAPMLHQNHIFAVRPGERLLPEFLVAWLDASPARVYFRNTAKKTTNIAATNKWTLGNLPVWCPPTVVQRDLIDSLTARTRTIDALITEAERFIDLARERRSALITAAVTGQLDIPEAS